jgi:uncharacterized RDD family membrane protein YckC
VADLGSRFGGRVVDAMAELALVVVALALVGDGDRPFAGLAIAWTVVFLYEAATTALFGTTPGKAAVGLRIIALDQIHAPTRGQGARRAAVSAAFATLPIVGWLPWILPTLVDPLHRGAADRSAGTMVVRKRAQLPISSRDLPGYADGARTPRVTTLGRVGDLDVRARARLRRLADAPLLGGAVGLLALAAALPVSTLTVVLVSSGAWVAAFVADETVRVHRTGRTAGHRMAGLVIVDRRTGRAPGAWRSFARALVLGLTLYVPVLWPLLLLSLGLMSWARTGRGLHDLAGGTVVVGDPGLDPEAQRQRAMRLRLGQAG